MFKPRRQAGEPSPPDCARSRPFAEMDRRLGAHCLVITARRRPPMTRPLAGLAVALGLATAANTLAAPPTISGSSPYGVRRGEAAEVTFDGKDLKGNPEIIAPFRLTL